MRFFFSLSFFFRKLDGNRLKCDCKLKWLLLHPSTAHVIGNESLKCETADRSSEMVLLSQIKIRDCGKFIILVTLLFYHRLLLLFFFSSSSSSSSSHCFLHFFSCVSVGMYVSTCAYVRVCQCVCV